MLTDRKTTHDAEHDARNDNLLIWVDGALVQKDEAKVSVYDSGFMLGDGMWEGLRLYDGEWAFFDAHMDRLFDALHAVSLDPGLTREELRDILDQTAAANEMTTDAHCRLMITRGRKAKPFQHPSLSRYGPTVVAILEHSKPSNAIQGSGVRLATVPQVRGLPMSRDPKFNSHSKLNCVIACLQAEQAGADEGLMLDPHGFVNTTNACNFFIVRRGEVWTSTGDYCMNVVRPAQVDDLLPGHAVHAVVSGRGPDLALAHDEKVAGIGGVDEAVRIEHQRLVGARLLGLQAGDHAVELGVAVVLGVLRHRQAAHLRHGREPDAA